TRSSSERWHSIRASRWIRSCGRDATNTARRPISSRPLRRGRRSLQRASQPRAISCSSTMRSCLPTSRPTRCRPCSWEWRRGSAAGVEVEMAAEFVGERGGGLLVFGAKSFAQQGLVGTELEEVLPVDLRDRGNGVVRTAARSGEPFKMSLTPEGESHPVMRIAATIDESLKTWSSIPALAGAPSGGAARPGAQVLAVGAAHDGVRPALAVQRYGRGRSMVFAGEASWRWRMQLPSNDRTHELFWRQAVRWLSSDAPDPVSAVPLSGLMPGMTATVAADIRSAGFQPVRDAEVAIRLTLPGGEVRDLQPA